MDLPLTVSSILTCSGSLLSLMQAYFCAWRTHLYWHKIGKFWLQNWCVILFQYSGVLTKKSALHKNFKSSNSLFFIKYSTTKARKTHCCNIWNISETTDYDSICLLDFSKKISHPKKSSIKNLLLWFNHKESLTLATFWFLWIITNLLVILNCFVIHIPHLHNNVHPTHIYMHTWISI